MLFFSLNAARSFGGKKSFSCSILSPIHLKRRIFATHLLLFPFVINFDFWAKFLLLGKAEFTKRPFSTRMNSSSKHSIEQKQVAKVKLKETLY